MSSLRKIVCLANSWKNRERCLAGIDLDSEKWVRPVCDRDERYSNDGRIPRSVRLLEGREPELLDIIEIPLSHTGNNFGFECENLSILSGPWRYLGKAQAASLIKYCSGFKHILHNSEKAVSPDYLRSRPSVQRRSLQLVQVNDFSVAKNKGGSGWRGTFSSHGARLVNAKITDPILTEKLEEGHSPSPVCLLTMSLSMPFPLNEPNTPPLCWKLIAGVIELPSQQCLRSE